MLLSLLNYSKGYVRIEVRGAYIERFLNICAKNHIDFWRLERLDIDVLRASVSIGGFRRLRRLSRRAMCRVHIVRKTGVPFFTWRVRRRYALVAGAALIAAALVWCSGYIWTINVHGGSRATQTQVLAALDELGFRPGIRRTTDVGTLRTEVMLRLPNVSWLAVNILGTNAEVIVRERPEKPAIVPQDEPSDIRADRSGVIVRMDVKAGQACVSVGHTVLAGDTLVTGKLVSASEYNEVPTRYVHSLADITLRSWYELRAVLPKTYYKKEYTGDEHTRAALLFADRRINLFVNSGNPYPFCDKINMINRLGAGQATVFPLALEQEVYRAFSGEKCVYTAAEADALLRGWLSRRLADQTGGGEVLKAEFTLTEDEGAFYGVYSAECIERVGEQMPLIPDAPNPPSAPADPNAQT